MLDQLRTLLGDSAVLADDRCKTWSVGGVVPRAVVTPANVEQVAGVLRWASSARIPIEPAGAGTWLNAGRPPHVAPIVLSTRGLQHIAEYEPADLVASLDAGVTVSNFQEVASAQRQFLALDAPAHRAATMGALVATASAGPLRQAYGAPRDQVLGLQLVTGDGRVLNLGGKVVKNVAGYDLTRLVVGSRGTLGVITRVHVRLRPLPARDATFQFQGPAPSLLALSAAAQQAALEPAALELISGAAAHDCSLYVRVQGNDLAVEGAALELAQVAGEAPTLLSDEDGRAVWQRLADASAGAQVSIRLAALPSAALHVWTAALQIHASLQQAQVALHAGLGIARVDGGAPVDTVEFGRSLAEAKRTLERLRGSVIVAVVPPELNATLPQFSAGMDTELRLMRELKKVFDPENILAPDRFSA
ncbi:MAG: FAD-binding oxidoreductase [Longimicrobiales bacterium]